MPSNALDLTTALKRVEYLEKCNRELVEKLLSVTQEAANLQTVFAPYPQPIGYVKEQDLLDLEAGRMPETGIQVSRECTPALSRYHPIYSHPQGAELERFRRLAFLWADASQAAESELFKERLEKFDL